MNQRFITGFTDGEGCFCLGLSPFELLFKLIYTSKIERGAGWPVPCRPRGREGKGRAYAHPTPPPGLFISIKIKSILEKIKAVLGVGYVSKMGELCIKYQVNSVKDLAMIIEHFDKYPLITQNSRTTNYLTFYFYL